MTRKRTKCLNCGLLFYSIEKKFCSRTCCRVFLQLKKLGINPRPEPREPENKMDYSYIRLSPETIKLIKEKKLEDESHSNFLKRLIYESRKKN